MNTLSFLANRVGSIHYTGRIGKRSESCGRKASDPKSANLMAGRVAGLHLVSTHDQVFSSLCGNSSELNKAGEE
jgi:hypothetical protein